MKLYCVFKKGSVEGAHPTDVCYSMDSARRSIRSRSGEFFIVVRSIRVEFGYSPETIEEQLEPRKSHGKNYYVNVPPFKVKPI